MPCSEFERKRKHGLKAREAGKRVYKQEVGPGGVGPEVRLCDDCSMGDWDSFLDALAIAGELRPMTVELTTGQLHLACIYF